MCLGGRGGRGKHLRRGEPVEIIITKAPGREYSAKMGYRPIRLGWVTFYPCTPRYATRSAISVTLETTHPTYEPPRLVYKAATRGVFPFLALECGIAYLIDTPYASGSRYQEGGFRGRFY